MLDFLLPDVPGLVLTKIHYGPNRLLLFTATIASQADCPLCHTVSEKIHSYYTRRIADLPGLISKLNYYFKPAASIVPTPSVIASLFLRGWAPLFQLAFAEPSAKPINFTQSDLRWAVKLAVLATFAIRTQNFDFY